MPTTLWNFLFKMDQKVVVKYYANSQYATAPSKAMEGSAGHDKFAAEARKLFPKSCTALTTTLKMAIPKGNFGKVFPRLGLLTSLCNLWCWGNWWGLPGGNFNE